MVRQREVDAVAAMAVGRSKFWVLILGEGNDEV